MKNQAREVLVLIVYQESTFPQHGKCGCLSCMSLGGKRTRGDRDQRSLRVKEKQEWEWGGVLGLGVWERDLRV